MSISTPATPTPQAPEGSTVYETLMRWQESDGLRGHLAAWCYAWFVICVRDKTAHRQHAYLDGIAELAGLLHDVDTLEALDALYRQAGHDGGGAAPMLDWTLRQICRWPLVDPRIHDARRRVALTRAVVWQAALWWRLHEVLSGHALPRPPDDPPLRCSGAAILAAAALDATMALERLEINRQCTAEEEEVSADAPA